MSDYIPEAIQVQILKFLPVKSLLRFRRVCKGWKEIIDSPTLMQDHLAVQKPHFIVGSNEVEFVVVNPLLIPPLVYTVIEPFKYLPSPMEVIGTLHGVVCLHLQSRFWLWNPSIRKYSMLPVLEPGFSTSGNSSAGFWIDPSNKEFKVIVLFVDRDDEEPDKVKVLIYSSRQHHWSVIPTGEMGRVWIPFLREPPLMIGGVAHWIGLYKDQGLENYTKLVMSFDFNQERFGFIEMNNPVDLGSTRPRLCLWQDTLSLVCLGNVPGRCEIYSMQEGSWVNMFGFEVLDPIKDVFWPLEGMEGWGEALAYGWEDTQKGKLVLYDSEAGCVPLTREFWYVNVQFGFVESLLLP